MQQPDNQNELHIVAQLIVADPKVIAETLIYEAHHHETDILNALIKLLECNRNEEGQNISAVVATATLPVNRQPYYLFRESDFAQAVLSHLSREQIDTLLQYNLENFVNTSPSRELSLIREVFGTPEIIKPNEGNSLLAHFLRLGLPFSSTTKLDIPPQKPVIETISPPNLAVLTLSMCLKQDFLPLMRHDGSHIHSGHNTTVTGEIYNQTYDLSVNALAQYGVVPTLEEQMLNRSVIYSFYGLPQEIKGLKRDWKEYVSEALEIWRTFLIEHPDYVEKWELSPFVDGNMRMVKSDGTPIISEQTGEQQIPVIDYTDLAVLKYLREKLINIISESELLSAMPYKDLYYDQLKVIDLLSIEHILRDGTPFILVNGMYDACATYKSVFYQASKPLELQSLSSKDPATAYDSETVSMRKKRSMQKDTGTWHGYLVDCGQDGRGDFWVTEMPPCLYVLHEDAVTIHRVSVPISSIEAASYTARLFDGTAYLVSPNVITVESQLSTRDERKIPVLSPKTSHQQHIPPCPGDEFMPFNLS